MNNSEGLKQIIATNWQQRGLIAWLLLPPALLFGLLAAARRLFYRFGVLRSIRLPVPVIVTGNITAGGSGKTPLVLWLAQRLRECGYRPGIISRGYGGSAGGEREVCAGDDAQLVGDEPLLLARRALCPVWIGRDRVVCAQALLNAHPECNVLISDDGLQHYRLARDVEIVVTDERGAGNGWLLPAGPLREPLSRVRRADALVINGGVVPPEFQALRFKPVFEMQLRGTTFTRLDDSTQTCDAGNFTGKRVHAIAGIGNPGRFFNHLSQLGLRYTAHAFPDHHRYGAADLAFEECDVLLMTEKDAVKCASFVSDIHCVAWVLRVDAELPSDFAEALLEKLYGPPAA